jgi:acyl-coenzyme A thioesterase PaaI-like protein
MRRITWQSLGGNAAMMRRFLNVWPPFAFSGIVVEEISDDFRRARVSLRKRFLTRNYVGTLFGGALFAMTDPFWMVMVLRNLGDDYVVWDKAGEIEFVTPGRETVYAEFEVTDELLDLLRAEAADGSKVLHWLETDIRTADGTLVARVRKQLYVRRRREAGKVSA